MVALCELVCAFSVLHRVCVCIKESFFVCMVCVCMRSNERGCIMSTLVLPDNMYPILCVPVCGSRFVSMCLSVSVIVGVPGHT